MHEKIHLLMGQNPTFYVTNVRFLPLRDGRFIFLLFLPLTIADSVAAYPPPPPPSPPFPLPPLPPPPPATALEPWPPMVWWW